MSGDEFYCADCGEPKEANEPNCGGRESGNGTKGETVRSPESKSAFAATNPTAFCPSCYYPHPDFKMNLAVNPSVKHTYKLHDRIRALEAELAAKDALAGNLAAQRDAAETEVIVLSHKADEGMKWRNEASRLEAELVEWERAKKFLGPEALDEWHSVVKRLDDATIRAEKAEAKLDQLRRSGSVWQETDEEAVE